MQQKRGAHKWQPDKVWNLLEHALPGIVSEEVALLHGQQRLGLSGGWQVAGAPLLPVPPGGYGIIGERHIAIPLTLSYTQRAF